MKIGIVCYPTYGGSGVVATELGLALAKKGNEIHFISYKQPVRLDFLSEKIFFHQVYVPDYPLFKFQPYELALSSKLVDIVMNYNILLNNILTLMKAFNILMNFKNLFFLSRENHKSS